MDSKNIDIKAISEIISRYKNAIINILVIVAALFISYKIYEGQQNSIEVINNKKGVELQKNTIIAEISRSDKKFTGYKQYLDKKDASSVIGTIGTLAADSAVEINSIRPGSEENLPVYMKYPVSVGLRVRDYHTLGKFIAKIESHPDVYIVKSLSIKPAGKGFDDDKSKVSADLEIYTIFVKK
ncbi:MAG: type 4a pilus biogenesis protein PilO [Candidatus Omnitrophota bacterium]|nr:type 4a pilus biogenesis protein PilO [Candidatus Omnitrophota bacterium]